MATSKKSVPVCQTMSPSTYREFIGAVGSGQAFNYTLVDAHRQ